MCSSDFMDDGTEVRLTVTIDRRDGSAVFDFEGTGPQVLGNTNAPRAVTYSAAIYALRCLVRRDIPLNGGCLAPVTIKVPPPSPTPAIGLLATLACRWGYANAQLYSGKL